MLIKYEDHMVNLDNVTDVIKRDDKRIEFYLNVPVKHDVDYQSITFFDFSTTENRDKAFDYIHKICDSVELRDD